MPDRSRTKLATILPTTRLQGRGPTLDVDGLQLLQRSLANVWRDLIFEQLAITLCRLRRDLVERLPLLNPRPNMLVDRQARSIDVRTLAH